MMIGSSGADRIYAHRVGYSVYLISQYFPSQNPMKLRNVPDSDFLRCPVRLDSPHVSMATRLLAGLDRARRDTFVTEVARHVCRRFCQ